MKHTALQLIAPCGLALLLAAPAFGAYRDESRAALDDAESAVAAAERAGAANLAPVELGIARGELENARTDCLDRRWKDCDRAAAFAIAEGRLAEWLAQQRSSQAEVAALEAEVTNLRVELAGTGA